MGDLYKDLSVNIPTLVESWSKINSNGKTYSLSTNNEIVARLNKAEHSNIISLGIFLENYLISLLEKTWKYPELIRRKYKYSKNCDIIDLYIEGRKLAFELKLGGSFYDFEKKPALEKKIFSWKKFGLKGFLVMFLSTEDNLKPPYLSGFDFCKLVKLDYEKIMNILNSNKTENDCFRDTIYQQILKSS